MVRQTLGVALLEQLVLTCRRDLAPDNRSRRCVSIWVSGSVQRGNTDEPEALYAGADHQQAASGGGGDLQWRYHPGGQQQDRCDGADLLSVARAVWGMRIDQAKRLKELERENGQLKKIVADQALDISILKEAASGNF